MSNANETHVTFTLTLAEATTIENALEEVQSVYEDMEDEEDYVRTLGRLINVIASANLHAQATLPIDVYRISLFDVINRRELLQYMMVTERLQFIDEIMNDRSIAQICAIAAKRDATDREFAG